MAASPSSKIAIVSEFLDRLGRLDIDGAAEFLDEDAVMTFPYLDQLNDVAGREMIVAQIKGTMVEMLEAMHFTYDAWYEPAGSGTGGSIVIGEYRSKCPIRGSSSFYENA
jgi:hypothetical protein